MSIKIQRLAFSVILSSLFTLFLLFFIILKLYQVKTNLKISIPPGVFDNLRLWIKKNPGSVPIFYGNYIETVIRDTARSFGVSRKSPRPCSSELSFLCGWGGEPPRSSSKKCTLFEIQRKAVPCPF